MITSAAAEAFIKRLDDALDFGPLEAWTRAIEAKLGIPVSTSLYKMLLLERWFVPSSVELDDACHGSATIRHFLGAPLHGPVAEVWMHRQFAPRLALAAPEIERLLVAIDNMLAQHGLSVPGPGFSAPYEDDYSSGEGTRTTALELRKLNVLDLDAESHKDTTSDTAGADTPAPGPRVDAGRHKAIALLVWPWGATTNVDRPLRLGRDATFSPYARQLWADAGISRRHAEIEPLGHGIGVRDLGSSNGTYIDDRLLPHGGGLVLTADAVLRFGTDLTVKLVFIPTAPTTRVDP